MTHDELLFQIGYSIRLEKMQSLFLSRIDRALNFLQMLLGIAVVTTTWPVTTGIAVSAFAAFSFVYQPGARSIEAKAQKQRYEKLISNASLLKEGELQIKFGEIQENDSQIIGALTHPAYIGECIRLDREIDFNLSLYEKLMACIAGDLPRK